VKKSLKKIPLGKKTRFIVTLVGDEIQNPEEKRIRQWQMIQALANTPDLMTCGTVPFESMKMGFSGERWLIEMQADVSEG
jgi:hypothetical protein